MNHTATTVADTHQKALEVNLDATSFGSFAEIGAGQEVARWFLRVGAASGTVAKTVSAYDKEVSDDLYGSGTRYVSRPRLETMLDCEWKSLVQQIGDARGKDTRLFAFADTIAARNFAGTNDCHGWIGVRFQDHPRAEASDILLHVNLRDNANLLQQEAVGILGVNLLHALLNERAAPGDLPARMFDNLANDRLEIDQIVMRGHAFAGCRMDELHTALARDGRAQAVTLDSDGVAVAANEFLYKKSVAIVPLANDPRDDLSPEAIVACLETLRREVAGNPEVKDVIDVRLMVVDSDAPLPAMGKGAAMMTRHRQLYRATAFARRYTQAPLRFAIPLPALIRIFDDVRYQHLEGRLLEGIARLFGSNVRVLAYPCPREKLLPLLETELGRGWEVDGSRQWITADQLLPAPPLRHLYEYLLASGFLVAMPGN
ncbi:hypothetical protein OHD62_21460 [Mesorhizobium sp. YC-39]|uniref:hypothetical protein n=1 Tax=unclassified Mesorhizobium TaxID=325217 RepID=UPI0021E92FCD|nr:MULTISPECIES: hypothetical protein [unclassified Mesorhizobium]MCV3210711.1 hypothetical protein [Mesorhizobium sp. YC-2]MCV3230945.1 hypothetical protein [Mesorhizobium sp. YC-39]